MAQIHEFSVVDPNAQLADDVVVGPFCARDIDIYSPVCYNKEKHR